MVQPDDLRRQWREALQHLLHASLRHGENDREYMVWKTRVDRIERVAAYNKIKLSGMPEDAR